jgi:hypothetical protein
MFVFDPPNWIVPSKGVLIFLNSLFEKSAFARAFIPIPNSTDLLNCYRPTLRQPRLEFWADWEYREAIDAVVCA